MRVQEFLEQLPGLYEGWGTGEMAPKAGAFGEILGSSTQPTTANFLALARWAAACLEPGEAIAEIGCYEGANLVAMLRDEPERLAYGVDFFSTQPEVAEERMGRLQENLDRFGVLERVCVAHQTVEDFFRELADLGAEDRFGLYLYGFEPDYRQVFLSLLLARRFWADSALVIVRNTESGPARQAIADFLELEPSFRLLLDWRCRGRQVFGAEGLGIFAWDTVGALTDWEPLRVEELSPPIRLVTSPPEGKKRVLHVGCGPYHPEALPRELRTEEWQEIRLDIDPNMKPDILGTITDLGAVPDESVDAVYSSHNLEHIYDYEVPLALAEFKRVLKPGGLTWLVVPDMQIAAEWVVKGDMDDQPLYQSPAGPVKALWMFYGMGTSIPGIPYMAHKTGFTASGLERRLLEAGFDSVEVSRGNFNVYGKGYKHNLKENNFNAGKAFTKKSHSSDRMPSPKILSFKKASFLQEKYPHYQIGIGTYSHDIKILEEHEKSTLSIGNYCSISGGVIIILGGEHNTDWVTTYPFSILNEIGTIQGHPTTKGDVIIGHDVWIGMNTLILSGVTIGNGAVVGAGSVITKSVPPYTIVGGNPARIIRKRFDESIIDELMQIEWWNWPDETIEASIHLLQSNKIQDFLEFAKSVSHSQ